MRILVIHVGLPKTGSTSLQHLLSHDERFAAVHLVPSKRARSAGDGGASCRDELRHVFEMRSNPRSRLKPATGGELAKRSKALARLLESDAEVVVFSEESASLSPHTDVHANAAVLSGAVALLRDGHPSLRTVLLIGTRSPLSLLVSGVSYFEAFRDQAQDTSLLESSLRESWASDLLQVFRQDEMVGLFSDAIRPDQVVLLPLELLTSDPHEYHRRLEAILQVPLGDLPLAGIRRNARPQPGAGDRVTVALPGPWRLLRAMQERLEPLIGPKALRRVPLGVRLWYGTRLRRARSFVETSDFSEGFVAWYSRQTAGQVDALRRIDPELDWSGMGY